MGSVKDLQVMRPPTESEMGIGTFTFSDRYSAFDWGEMPDHIPYKGAALCMMSAYFLEKLNTAGVPTHYMGLEDGTGGTGTMSVHMVEDPVNRMHVRLVRVLKPVFSEEGGKRVYDYSVFRQPDLANFLIPIEWIYRNRLPQGSSVFRRLTNGELTYQDLGLDHEPVEGEILPRHVIDISTKLEQGDKYPSWKEMWPWAMSISGMSEAELEEAKQLVRYCNEVISRKTEQVKLVNEDGKVEFGYDSERKLMVLDVLGTLDECRFTYDGMHMSKEMLRQWYGKHQLGWVKEIKNAKKQAEEQGIEDWKSLVTTKPVNVDPEFINIVSNAYMSVANALLGRSKLFDAPSLHQVAADYRKYVGALK